MVFETGEVAPLKGEQTRIKAGTRVAWELPMAKAQAR
jgi:hypothetical protein